MDVIIYSLSCFCFYTLFTPHTAQNTLRLKMCIKLLFPTDSVIKNDFASWQTNSITSAFKNHLSVDLSVFYCCVVIFTSSKILICVSLPTGKYQTLPSPTLHQFNTTTSQPIRALLLHRLSSRLHPWHIQCSTSPSVSLLCPQTDMTRRSVNLLRAEFVV